MDATQLLTTLRERNVRVWLEGDEIRCRGPRGALTPELRGFLAEFRADIIRILHSAAANRGERPLERLGRSGDLPLSFAQERLWFLQRMSADSSAYNMTGVALLKAPYDRAVLESSLMALAERQDVLRTRFPSRAGRPVAEIGAAQLELEVVDFKGEKDALAAEIEFGRALSRKSFAFEHGPTFRAAVGLVSDEEQILYLSVPHIICDRWSMEMLFADFSEIYTAMLDGREPTLTELPFNYTDFAAWQRNHLDEKSFERLLAYWLDKLRNAKMLLTLPLDRGRRPLQQHRAATKAVELSSAVSERIRAVSSSLGTTPYVVLLGAFGIMLARYAGEEDVLVGSPIADRRFPELEKVAGLFVNTVVLRVACAGEQSVGQFISALHGTVLDANAHQDLPFEKLVERLNPERSLSHAPLVQTAFSFQSTERAEEVPILSGAATKFDLAMFMTDGSHEFTGAIEYSADLFDDITIDRMIEVFQTIVEGIVADPDRMLGDVPDMPAKHAEKLFVEWNSTATNYPRTSSVATEFEAQVLRSPDAPALLDEDVELSYQQLDQQANRLAWRLRDAGVHEGARVGVLLERSHKLVVAMLAVLKAGAAYVPIDPALPRERQRLILKDASASAVLVGGADHGDWADVELSVIDTDVSPPDAVERPTLTRAGDAEGLAYVMYTSGSTGKPKGVCVTQRGILRLVLNTNFVAIDPGDSFLQFAPASFDAATFEIWGALLNGARLVIAPPGPLSSAELGRVVRERGISILWLTAGLFHQVVDAGLDDFRTVKQLLAGGDVLSVQHVRKALRALPGCNVINGYGPTENTTFSCCHTMNSEGALEGLQSVPIGRPIANTTAFVLDGRLRPVPIGAVGELCVGGDGVARGYLGDDALTAAKFVNSPFADTPPDRLYRTGDLVRYRQDGALEFIGRRDNQIKLRGFRIELGEIEATLKSHPAVSEGAVVVRQVAGQDKVLAGYYSLRGRQTATPADLRRFLHSRLPQYMVPSTLDVVDGFKLGPTGKVDRQALPMPLDATRRGVAPQRVLSPLENQIAAIWEQVLNVRDVQVTDDFFDLGGTSLAAVKLFSQLKEVFGRDLPLAMLFQAPTVERLAEVMQTDGWEPRWKSLVAIQPSGTKTPLFVVPGVGGNVLGFAHLANLLGPDQPFYGCQSRGLDGREPPLRRIEDMAAVYIKEIREIQPQGPYFLAGSCMGGVVAFEMAQQLQDQGEKVSMLVLIETWLPKSLRGRYHKAFSFFQPAVFVVLGVWRHTRALIRRGPRGWLSGLRTMIGIGLDMLRQRDIYRGDQQILYRDVVSATNFRAMANYVPRRYRGHVHLFLASERPVDPRRDTRMEWARLAEDGYELDTVKVETSGEFYKHPYVDQLAEKLRSALSKARVDDGTDR